MKKVKRYGENKVNQYLKRNNMKSRKGILPGLPDEKVLELLNLEEIKADLKDVDLSVVPGQDPNLGIHTPQDIVNKQLNKTMNQTDTIAAERKIDNDIIQQALNVKKAKVLDDLDELIQNEKHNAEHNSGSK